MAARAVAALVAVDSSRCLSFVSGFLPFLSTSCRAVQRTKVLASSYKQLETLYSTLFMVSANGYSPQLLMTGKGPSTSLANLCKTEQRGCCYYCQYKVFNRPQNRKIKTAPRHVREISSYDKWQNQRRWPSTKDWMSYMHNWIFFSAIKNKTS